MTPDFSSALAVLDPSGIVSSFIAAAALVALVLWTQWAARFVGQFFDSTGKGRHGENYALCDECGERIYGDDRMVYAHYGDIFCGECADDLGEKGEL